MLGVGKRIERDIKRQRKREETEESEKRKYTQL
jgi:hypothetical protein